MQARPTGLPPGRRIMRTIMRRGRRAAALSLPLALGACGPSVLDPQGYVGLANRQIMLDSLVIMLAIVVPVIVATAGVAWWFRASNTRARYMPEFVYSGSIELVIWSIPLMTIMLLGGVAWVGSHELDPAAPLPSKAAPVNVQVVSLDWKWLFIYPDQGVASVNRLVIPAGAPVHFVLTSASVMNVFFVPQLGSMIYVMNGMADQLNLIADHPGTFYGESAMISGDGFPTMHFDVDAVPADQFAAWVTTTQGSGPGLTAQILCRPREAEHEREALHLSQHRRRPVPQDRRAGSAAGPGPRDLAARPTERGRRSEHDLVRHASAGTPIPFDQPIPLVAGAVVMLGILAVLAWIVVEGLPALSLARMDHQRRSQADRRDVLPARPRHAVPRLHRRHHDALAAGDSPSTARATCRPSISTRSSRRTAR